MSVIGEVKEVATASLQTILALMGGVIGLLALAGSVTIASNKISVEEPVLRVVAAVGFVSLIALAIWVQSSGSAATKGVAPTKPVAGDLLDQPGFARAMFDALPPVFVKEKTGDAKQSHVHVLDNEALKAFQGRPDHTSVSPGLKAIIADDHAKGDSEAYENGFSWQFEAAAPGGLVPVHEIFTMKKRFVHFDRVFLVGMYVPVETSELPRGESVAVKVWGQLPVFSPLLDGDTTIEAKIGEATRTVAKKRSGGVSR